MLKSDHVKFPRPREGMRVGSTKAPGLMQARQWDSYSLSFRPSQLKEVHATCLCTGFGGSLDDVRIAEDGADNGLAESPCHVVSNQVDLVVRRRNLAPISSIKGARGIRCNAGTTTPHRLTPVAELRLSASFLGASWPVWRSTLLLHSGPKVEMHLT